MKKFICAPCNGVGHIYVDNLLSTQEVEVERLGHRNQAGGACCPHAGNTCGAHPGYSNHLSVQRLRTEGYVEVSLVDLGIEEDD